MTCTILGLASLSKEFACGCCLGSSSQNGTLSPGILWIETPARIEQKKSLCPSTPAGSAIRIKSTAWRKLHEAAGPSARRSRRCLNGAKRVSRMDLYQGTTSGRVSPWSLRELWRSRPVGSQDQVTYEASDTRPLTQIWLERWSFRTCTRSGNQECFVHLRRTCVASDLIFSGST